MIPQSVKLSIMFCLNSKPSSSEKKKVADDYTDYLREKSWEFGVCDDDLILLLSVGDRLVSITVPL